MFYKNVLGLSFVVLLSTSTLTHAMKGEEEGNPPVQTYPRKNSLKKNTKEKFTFENFPTQTTCLKDAFELVIELFELNLSHFQFMDGLLMEVMHTEKNMALQFQGYFGKINLAFEKGQVVKGRTEVPIENHCSELRSIHQVVIQKYTELINDLKGRLVVINQINELCKKNKVLPDLKIFAQAADLFIKEFTEYKKSESERIDNINEGYNKYRQHKTKTQEFKTSKYTEVFKEDYLITSFSDIVVIFSKAIDILAPHSSYLPDNRDRTEAEGVKEPPKQIDLKRTNNKSKRRRDRKRPQAQRRPEEQNKNKSFSFTPSEENEKPRDQNQSHLPILEDGFSDEKKEDVKESTLQAHLPVPQEETVSLSKGDEQESPFPKFKEEQIQTLQKIIETNSRPMEKETAHSFETSNNLSTHRQPKKRKKHKPQTLKVLSSSPSLTLQISRRNFKTLEEVFTHPILDCISMDSFDTMIESEAGFRGRVYGGHRSHIYEVYLLLTEEQKPVRFLSFEEFQRGKTEKNLIKKYSFTLHRPHLRGKNKKGNTRNMYPQLVTLARRRLEDFKFTPDTIRPK
jgi:hypothetical protein